MSLVFFFVCFYLVFLLSFFFFFCWFVDLFLLNYLFSCYVHTQVTDNELRRMIRTISKSDDKISWAQWREFMMLFPTTHVRDIFRYELSGYVKAVGKQWKPGKGMQEC